MNRTEKSVAVLTSFALLLWAAFWGAVIYVAWHFISKLW